MKKILAEGDSWLKYPRSWVIFGKDSNIIHHLKDEKDNNNKKRFKIKNMASNGDEVVDMLSGESKIDLIEELKDNAYDILLFSGGGNDIVGNYDFQYFIKPFKLGQSMSELIYNDRYNRKLEQMMDSYRNLVDITLHYSKNPKIQIVTHTYELVRSSAQGAKIFGINFGDSWMYPYFEEKGYHKNREGRKAEMKIVFYLLDQFKENLVALGAKLNAEFPNRFYVVDTHGKLTNAKHWRNEIHPNSEGFEIIEKEILTKGIDKALEDSNSL